MILIIWLAVCQFFKRYPGWTTSLKCWTVDGVLELSKMCDNGSHYIINAAISCDVLSNSIECQIYFNYICTYLQTY